MTETQHHGVPLGTTTTEAPGADPMARLLIAELDDGSRRLGTDLVHAVTSPGHPRRWAALALVAWLLARRDDPGAKPDAYDRLTPAELSAVLGLDGPAPVAHDTVDAELAADPTGPAPG